MQYLSLMTLAVRPAAEEALPDVVHEKKKLSNAEMASHCN
jgi:hypothetical protein